MELSALTYVSGLIGGRGRWNGNKIPLSQYALTMGKLQRFRLVHSGAEYSYEVSVDDHVMIVVQSDAYAIQPITVDFFMIHPGETIDFEIVANQNSSRYWLRATTLREGLGPRPINTRHAREEVRAILYYNNSEGDVRVMTDPVSKPKVCSRSHPCIVFNCPFKDYPEEYNRTCINVDSIRSVVPQDSPKDLLKDQFGLKDENVVEVFLNFAFVIGSSINARQFVPPRGFTHPHRHLERHTTPCDETVCATSGCRCTNTLSLPFNVTVQVVLLNAQPGCDLARHAAPTIPYISTDTDSPCWPPGMEYPTRRVSIQGWIVKVKSSVPEQAGKSTKYRS